MDQREARDAINEHLERNEYRAIFFAGMTGDEDDADVDIAMGGSQWTAQEQLMGLLAAGVHGIAVTSGENVRDVAAMVAAKAGDVDNAVGDVYHE